MDYFIISSVHVNDNHSIVHICTTYIQTYIPVHMQCDMYR